MRMWRRRRQRCRDIEQRARPPQILLTTPESLLLLLSYTDSAALFARAIDRDTAARGLILGGLTALIARDSAYTPARTGSPAARISRSTRFTVGRRALRDTIRDPEAVIPGVIIAASILSARALQPVEQILGALKNVLTARESYKNLSKFCELPDAAAPRTAMPGNRRPCGLGNSARSVTAPVLVLTDTAPVRSLPACS